METTVLIYDPEFLQKVNQGSFYLPISIYDDMEYFIESANMEEYGEKFIDNAYRARGFLDNPFFKAMCRKINTGIPYNKGKPFYIKENVGLVFVAPNYISNFPTREIEENFHPVEIDILVIALKENIPILTADSSFMEKISQYSIPVEVVLIGDREEKNKREKQQPLPVKKKNKKLLLGLALGGVVLILILFFKY